MPLLAFVDARLLYDQGRFEEAVPLFEQSLEEQTKAGNVPLVDLHYYAADTYARLERFDEAETQFTAELRDFPYHLRARAGLAALYHTMGRSDDAVRAIGEMTDVLPTPESFTLAAKLWTTIGNRLQAEAVRAELRERFAEPARQTARQR
jgi:tetratricopeptide (TPR) repeat protein